MLRTAEGHTVDATVAGYIDNTGALRPAICGECCHWHRIQRGWTPLYALNGSEPEALAEPQRATSSTPRT